MNALSISTLGIISNDEEEGLLEISVQDYETRIVSEIDKYYSTDMPQAGPDLQNLSFAERTDILDLSNTYSYLTPATISGQGGAMSTLNQGEALWAATSYQNLYSEGLSLQQNPGIAPTSLASGVEKTLNDLSTIGVTITTKPELVAVGSNTAPSPYINPRNLLGENTKFVNQDIFRFESLPTLTDLQAEQADLVLTSIADSLSATQNITEFESLTVKVSDFDFSVPNNTMDTNLRNPGPANDRSIFGIPPQLKSLMLGRSKSTRKNWLDSSVDPVTDPETSGMMQFNYFEIQEVQALVKYNADRKKPTYSKLTKAMIDQIKKNGGSIFCRTVTYQTEKVIPSAKRNLNYRRNDQYFLINGGETNKPATKKVNSLTAFGQELMKGLVKSSENLRDFEQLQQEAESAFDAAQEAASSAAAAASSALDALSNLY